MICKPIYKDLLKIQYDFLFAIYIFFVLFNGLFNGVYNNEIDRFFYTTGIFCVIAIGLALFQTYQMKKEQVIQFYGSLPIKKNQFLYSNYFAGITILLSGYVIHSCIILIHDWNIMLQISNLALCFVIGGLIMLFLYSIFFFFSIVHSQNRGVLISMVFLFIFFFISVLIVIENQNQPFNIVLHCFWMLRGWGRTYIDFCDPLNHSILANDINYWIHICVYSISIIVLCVLMGLVYKKKNDANKRSLFCCTIPGWAWMLLGAFLGYTLVGLSFLLFSFIFNYVQSLTNYYLYDFYASDFLGLIAHIGAMFGILGASIWIDCRKRR